MSKSQFSDSPHSSSQNQQSEYHMILFVANDEPNSRIVKNNLVTISKNGMLEKYQMETIDVLEDFTLAAKHSILVTPTLLIIKPESTVMVIGNLNDHQQVWLALGLERDETISM